MRQAVAVSVIDPSLFTAPYDTALVRALRHSGADAELVGRPLRAGEEVPDVPYRAIRYRRFDAAPRRLGLVGGALKALEHLADSLAPPGPNRVAHYQWLPLPIVDGLALRLWRRQTPVVVTVHDTQPFNDSPTHRLQALGFRAALAAADRLIVHTASGRERLVRIGLEPGRIAVVPHGPLGAEDTAPDRPAADPYTLVAFGKIRPYKGLDILLDAFARLSGPERARLRLVIAGEPLSDPEPLARRIRCDALEGSVDLLPRRFDQREMQDLFGRADAFVFPYREIEASGVFYLVQGLGRWIIASRLGAFAEALDDGVSGRLVAPCDPEALSSALREAAAFRPSPRARPRVTGWHEIARSTLEVYAAARRDRASGRPVAGPVPSVAR